MAYFWRENMLRYLSAGIFCSRTQTVSFKEQKMPKDKYQSKKCQVEAIVTFKYFRNAQDRFQNWGISLKCPQVGLY